MTLLKEHKEALDDQRLFLASYWSFTSGQVIRSGRQTDCACSTPPSSDDAT